jgi:GIY-YIG catalytic domain
LIPDGLKNATSVLTPQMPLVAPVPSRESGPSIGENDHDGSKLAAPIPLTGGVYAIVNTINGLRYVGSATNLRGRKSAHWNKSRQYDPPHLRYDWSVHGAAAFAFVVVVLEPDPKLRKDIEAYYIDHWSTWDPRYGYNLTFGSACHAPLARLYLEESRLVKKRRFHYMRGVSINTPVQYDYLERWEASLPSRVVALTSIENDAAVEEDGTE